MEKTDTVLAVALHPAIDRVLELDAIAVGEHIQGRTTDRHPAGKAVNVARILGQLGHRPILTGFVGERDAAWFEQFVAADGVQGQLFAVEGATRENITLIGRQDGQELHIRDVGFTVGEKDLERLAAKVRLLARPAAAVVFAGSLPPGVDAEAFVRLIRGAIERGAKVAVDCSGPAAHAAAGEPLWLAKPNLIELEAMVGRPVTDEPDQLAACRQLTGKIRSILLSRGAEGAWVVNGTSALAGRVRMDPAQVRNTVGCGDALLAGILAGALEGASGRDALVRALSVASSAAATPTTGHIDRSLLDPFARAAEVRDLGA